MADALSRFNTSLLIFILTKIVHFSAIFTYIGKVNQLVYNVSVLMILRITACLRVGERTTEAYIFWSFEMEIISEMEPG